MTTKLLLPALLLVAACGDNLEPTDDETSPGTEAGTGQNEETPARPILASPLIYFPSCDAAVAQYEADARYADTDDLEIVPNISCRWTFDDGTTSTSCAGEHTFAEGGWHDFILEVTDLDTGATDQAVQHRYVYPPIEANLDVTTGDRTITWNATVNVSADVRVFVQPEELIVTDDPFYYFNRSYTLEVLRDGTYTVVMIVEDERPTGPICSARIEKQVNVFCTGGNHTHTP
ncbi:MAG TPA: PKD domain-containing protein [Kofleriaceae bacterium]